MVASLPQNFTCEGYNYQPTAKDIVKTVVIVIVMILIILGNVCCLIVFNSPKTKRNFMKRMRYIMTSLCCTDLFMGALVCPSTIYSALYHCWPFGEPFCKIEALLLSALFHESTLNLVLIAVDRYFVVNHSISYNRVMTSKKFAIIIISTWIIVFMTYAVVIFAGEQFYFDEIGVNCEPYYENRDVTVSVISLFYFLPAAIFLFCYGAIYRKATRKKVMQLSQDDKHSRMVNANIRTSKYLAAITLAFFVAISPWTLCTLLIVTVPIQNFNHDADFFVTWLAISNSFMNCLIYGVMNRKFRRAAARLVCEQWLTARRSGFTSSSKEEDYSEESGSRFKIGRYTKRKSRRTMHLKGTPDISSTPASTPLTTPRHSPKPSARQTEKDVQL